MTVENTQETGNPADTVVMPERPMATPEIPESNQDVTPEGQQVPNTPEQPATPSEPTEIEVYQDILLKHSKDQNFEMSDAESDVFLSVQEQIANGSIKEPGLPDESKDNAPINQQKPENSKEDTPTQNTEDATANKVDFGLSNENADKLQKAMQMVGAKDISEIDSKIDGLLKTMKSSGGKLGSQLKELQDREANHVQWLNDLQEGKPEAQAYLEKILGKSSGQNAPQASRNTADSTGKKYDASQFLDDELGQVVLSQNDEIKELKSMVEKLSKGDAQRAEFSQREIAANGWVDDVVDLVVKNSDAFNLSPSEARELGKQYWGPEGHTKPIHPKFQEIHELIKYAHEKNMPDLETAHVMYQHENGVFAKKLIEATKQGQQSVQHAKTPNSVMSNNQSRMRQNTPDPHIDENAVNAMKSGDFDSIPDEWMDETGTLLPDKVPERLHEYAFGKMGKPRR